MEPIDQILNRRTNPAVLILDRNDRLLYFNREAQAFLQRSSGTPPQAATEDPVVPGEIIDLCQGLKASPPAKTDRFNLIRKNPGGLFCAKAHFLKPAGNSKQPDHIIVVIQPVVQSHVDLKKVREGYGLTRREGEVLKLICGGCTNKEISDQLYISEFTTRDHLKNIMRKMGVTSRNKIIAMIV
ncbi:MAG: helix-turn-helix transcriptional regulator [Deltaproteobacteria bacterium]|nr:helix-turn-helix transcriptional regulator [Deltaproteobacteria bacterium]